MKWNGWMIPVLALSMIAGCTSSETERARQKAKEAGRELKEELRPAGEKAKEAGRQLKEELKDAGDAAREGLDKAGREIQKGFPDREPDRKK